LPFKSFVFGCLTCIILLAASALAAKSTDITLDISDGQLGATLLLPDGDGPWPVVLILAGSGPVDRDGNQVSVPGKNNSLQQLAEGLALQGVASLRTDKRGVAGSSSAAKSEKDLRFDDFINDAAEWTAMLQGDQRFSSVSIAGHSQGSQVGMCAAWLKGADGFISLAGPGRPILEILRKQLHGSLNIRSRVKANAILDELEAGHLVPEPPTDMSILFRPSVQEFLISWQRQNPQQMIGRLSCPVAIIQGLNDLQVTEEDARLLAEARSGSSLLLLPGINHLFKPIESSNPIEHQMTLANPDLKFSQEAIDAVVVLTEQAEVFHRQWAAALDRAAQYNQIQSARIPADFYSTETVRGGKTTAQKLPDCITNRKEESFGYRFGLDENGYVSLGRLFTNGNYDCVSFMYRCTEMARAESIRDNLSWALRTRFAGAHPDSVVDAAGRVDYERPEHLDYSLDMIRSGIWGRDISAEVGVVRGDDIGTSRYGAKSFGWVPAEALDHSKLRPGDIVWLVLNPKNSKARKLRDDYGLVVGHLGLMSIQEGRPVLVHAASSDLAGEYRGGQVVAVDLATYLNRVDRYAGVIITRIED